ncbi:MAG: choice-of-anchor D domain-containing protein, partial [Lentisphaerae bacterium]|nr:choice-of-anchor D domain-containing protein [Lentisphaerota bacterium]
MTKRAPILAVVALLSLACAGQAFAASFTGGSGDGWGMGTETNGFYLGSAASFTGGSGDGWGAGAMTNNLGLGGAQVTFSSATNQAFAMGDAATAISMITITDDPGSPGISNGFGILVSIPSALRMTWDETDLSATFGGSAVGKVGAIGYTNANKTLIVNVTANFIAGDTLTISDLSFKNFMSTGAGNLELDFDGDGMTDAVDDKSATITSVSYYGGAGDGHDALATTNFQLLGDMRMAVLGTNGGVVANGEAPSAAKGTDFGNVPVSAAATNVFSITNAGGTTMTIAGWTTNGTGAGSFRVVAMPPQVAPHTISNLAIAYDPEGIGLSTGTLSIVNNSTNTPYGLNLRGSAYQLSTNAGPNAGGNMLIITNGALGGGADITNVTVCGVTAAIVDQGANWVRVTLGAGGSGLGDIVIYSTSQGVTVFSGCYTYNPAGIINAVNPGAGPASGGTSVAIVGSNLCNGADAT